MKIAYTIILVILTLLAAFSGIAKLLLVPQEVDFFGRYGFSNIVIIAFGAVQLIGGILLILGTTRFVGAALVAITFLVSLVLLLVDGNILMSAVTLVMTILLIVIMRRSWKGASTV